MAAFVFRDKFVVDWSPKAGCSSVCRMWLDESNQLEQAINDGWRQVGWPPGMDIYKPAEHKNSIIIKFTRNPYTRAVSSFIQAAHMVRPGKVDIRDGKFEGGDLTQLSFRDFVFHFLPHRLNMLQTGTHWKPQYNHMFLDRAEDHVIHIEKLSEGSKILNNKYGLKLNPDKFNKANAQVHEKIHQADYFNVKFKDFKTCPKVNRTIVPSYSSFYNEDVKQQVYKIYKKDIDTYGYTYDL